MLRNKVLSFLIVSFALFAGPLLAKTKLRPLSGKQDIANIRFVSFDGKHTYYQRRSGSFLLSTNYDVKEVLKATPGTQYNVISTPARRYIIVVQDELFQKFYGSRALKKLYKLKYGGLRPLFLANGTDPQLHLGDTWVSYYDPFKRVLFFQDIYREAIKFQIQLTNTINPYFTPARVMISETKILYTDTNKKGLQGAIMMDRIAKKSDPFFKAEVEEEKLEICRNRENVFLSQIGINRSKNASIIYKISIDQVQMDKAVPVYESPRNEIGNIICDLKPGKLHFVQNTSTGSAVLRSEVVELNIKTKKTEILTDLDYASQVLNIDGRLLVPHNGEIYVLVGAESLKMDALPMDAITEKIKGKELPKPKPKPKKDKSKKTGKKTGKKKAVKKSSQSDGSM